MKDEETLEPFEYARCPRLHHTFTPWVGQSEVWVPIGQVEVKLANGLAIRANAKDMDWSWNHSLRGSDIIAYRKAA